MHWSFPRLALLFTYVATFVIVVEEIRSIALPALFSDVTDDFRTLPAVKSRFETWKSDFYDDYVKAYGSLSLPGAFEFFVRCELVTWNPFLVRFISSFVYYDPIQLLLLIIVTFQIYLQTPQDFETMQWHVVLSDYSVASHHDASAEDTDADADANLLNKIVEKIVVPRIIATVDTLDIGSDRQMTNALVMMEQVLYYVDKQNTAYKVCSEILGVE